MTRKLLSVLLAVLMVCSIIPLSALQTFAAQTDTEAVANGGEYPELVLDSSTLVNITSEGDSAFFKFVPEKSGSYSFYSTGEYDTKAYLYDSEFEEIDSNDDGGDDSNFEIIHRLKANNTYYLEARLYESDATGQFYVSVKRAKSNSDYPELTVGGVTHAVFQSGSNSAGFIVCPSEAGVYRFYTTADMSIRGDLYTVNGDWEAGTSYDVEDLTFMASLLDEEEYCLLVYPNVDGYDNSEDYEFDIYCEAAEFDQIYEDSETTVQITTPGDYAMYKFVPETSGSYAIYSTGQFDTKAVLLDSEFYEIADDDDGGEDNNFRVVAQLEAGSVYYLKARFYDGDRIGKFKVGVEKTVTVTGMELLSPPTNCTCYEGFEGNVNYTGLSVRTTWSDGEVVDWTYDGENEYVRKQRISFGYDYNDNEIYVYCGDQRLSIPVTIIENPVSYIEITEGASATVIEHTNGRWGKQNNTGDDIYIYWTGDIFYGVTAVIHYKDGTSEPVELGDTLNGNRFQLKDDQNNEPYTLGKNKVYATYLGVDAELELNIIQNPVLSLELISPSNCEYFENTNGYYDEYYNDKTGENEEFFYYSLYNNDLEDAEIKINFNDGTSVTAHIGDTVRGYEVGYTTDQYSKPWTLGKNTYMISYLGVEVADTVTIVSNPVKSIELLDVDEIIFVEGTNGYWSSKYNYETGESDLYYYRYSLDSLYGQDVLITFKDGSTLIAGVNSIVMGEYIELYDNQYSKPWTVGGDNCFTLSFMGVEAKIPVTIAPTPVVGFECVKPTEKKLIENGDGYWYTAYNPDTGEYDLEYFSYEFPTDTINDAEFKITFNDGTTETAHLGDKVRGATIDYSIRDNDQWTVGSNNFITVDYMGVTTQMPIEIIETPVLSISIDSAPSRVYYYGDTVYGGEGYFAPSDYTGLKFTVNYKDGSKKTYTDKDIKNSVIDGHFYSMDYPEKAVIGDNEVTFSYLGVSAKYNVRVVESPIEKVEMVELPTNSFDYQYYSTDWRGTKIRVTYKNGTTSEITLDKDNVLYERTMYFGTQVTFMIDGIKGELGSRRGEDGKGILTVYLVDKEDVKTGFELLESKKIDNVEVEDFTPSCENMLVKITYEDGSKESFRIHDAINCGNIINGNITTLIAYAPRGVADIMVYDQDSPNSGNILLRIFGKQITRGSEDEKEYILGDADGDGAVTVSDATLLQKYLAEYKLDNKKQIVMAGDANQDGILSISDVTLIQQYAAGMPVSTPIGEKI